jgi:hypothetical protein
MKRSSMLEAAIMDALAMVPGTADELSGSLLWMAAEIVCRARGVGSDAVSDVTNVTMSAMHQAAAKAAFGKTKNVTSDECVDRTVETISIGMCTPKRYAEVGCLVCDMKNVAIVHVRAMAAELALLRTNFDEMAKAYDNLLHEGTADAVAHLTTRCGHAEAEVSRLREAVSAADLLLQHGAIAWRRDSDFEAKRGAWRKSYVTTTGGEG